MKRLAAVFFVVALLAFASVAVSAAPNGYEITSYDITMDVGVDNNIEITERIEIYATEEKHGIIRNIPTQVELGRADNTQSSYRAIIRNLRVSEEYSTDSSGGELAVKIGDADETFTGAHSYIITYDYQIGKYATDGFDEFYMNVIGTSWDTTISNITFTINMPAEFDAEKLGFTHGVYNSRETGNVEYEVIGNSITGRYIGTLDAYEGIAARLELPDGYFIEPEYSFDWYTALMIAIPLAAVIFAFILYIKHGKEFPSVEPVAFYPPAGMNSAETGFVYKFRCVPKDIMSLLIYLAGKGYLKITEKGNTFFGHDNYEITKLREYDGNNHVEEVFMRGLFEVGDTVTEKDLKYKFHTTVSAISKSISSKTNKNKIIEPMPVGKVATVFLLTIASFLIITLRPMLEYYGSGELVFVFLFPIIGLCAVLLASISSAKGVDLFLYIWGFLFGGVAFIGMAIDAYGYTPFYIPYAIFGFVCIVVVNFFLRTLPRRTAYGARLYGEIKGFRRFLQYAEKPKLEELVNENPSYFYDVLPYTYVLGLSSKWIKKFEGILSEPPDWYHSSSGTMSFVAFSHFMNSTMNTGMSAMSSSPGGGSGGGGGGFSGGGGGGGGGSSW